MTSSGLSTPKSLHPLYRNLAVRGHGVSPPADEKKPASGVAPALDAPVPAKLPAPPQLAAAGRVLPALKAAPTATSIHIRCTRTSGCTCSACSRDYHSVRNFVKPLKTASSAANLRPAHRHPAAARLNRSVRDPARRPAAAGAGAAGLLTAKKAVDPIVRAATAAAAAPPAAARRDLGGSQFARLHALRVQDPAAGAKPASAGSSVSSSREQTPRADKPPPPPAGAAAAFSVGPPARPAQAAARRVDMGAAAESPTWRPPCGTTLPTASHEKTGPALRPLRSEATPGAGTDDSHAVALQMLRHLKDRHSETRVAAAPTPAPAPPPAEPLQLFERESAPRRRAPAQLVTLAQLPPAAPDAAGGAAGGKLATLAECTSELSSMQATLQHVRKEARAAAAQAEAAAARGAAAEAEVERIRSRVSEMLGSTE